MMATFVTCAPCPVSIPPASGREKTIAFRLATSATSSALSTPIRWSLPDRVRAPGSAGPLVRKRLDGRGPLVRNLSEPVVPMQVGGGVVDRAREAPREPQICPPCLVWRRDEDDGVPVPLGGDVCDEARLAPGRPGDGVEALDAHVWNGRKTAGITDNG